jgi:hypothetical protein
MRRPPRLCACQARTRLRVPHDFSCFEIANGDFVGVLTSGKHLKTLKMSPQARSVGGNKSTIAGKEESQDAMLAA